MNIQPQDLLTSLFRASFCIDDENVHIDGQGIDVQNLPHMKKYYFCRKHVITVPVKSSAVDNFFIQIHSSILGGAVKIINAVLQLPLLALSAKEFLDLRYVPHSFELCNDKSTNFPRKLTFHVACNGRLEEYIAYDLNEYLDEYLITIDNKKNKFLVPLYDMNVLVNNYVLRALGMKTTASSTDMYNDLMNVI